MDELHAWKNRDLWSVIDAATGARQQPLIVTITTAGYNRQTVCWEQHIHLKKILAGQGFASMSPPMKELEKLVISSKLAHGGNQVLAWMADNVVAVQDPAGNIKPDKSKSIEKIDGIVALIMGLDRALHGEVPMKKSIYEERGLRVV